MTGIIGWSRSGEQLANVWNDDSKSWVDEMTANQVSATSPFAFSVDKRYIGILKHPTFKPMVVAGVLQEMLNRAEARRDDAVAGIPNVLWGVDPVGDRSEFKAWIDRTDAVTSLEFVFMRPNPDAEDAFQHLFDRLDALESSKICERIVARNPETGINKQGLQQDATSGAFITAAMAAFGYVVGKGFRNGRKVKFDQRQNMMTEEIEHVGSTWESATLNVKDAVQRATGRAADG